MFVLQVNLEPIQWAKKNAALDSMKHIKKKQTPEEILNLVNGHLEKGEGSKAKYLMTLTTGLGIKEKRRSFKVYVS